MKWFSFRLRTLFLLQLIVSLGIYPITQWLGPSSIIWPTDGVLQTHGIWFHPQLHGPSDIRTIEMYYQRHDACLEFYTDDGRWGWVWEDGEVKYHDYTYPKDD